MCEKDVNVWVVFHATNFFFKRITLGRISKKRVKFSIEIVMVRKNLKKSLETKGLQVGATLLDTLGR
jgi:hypothetical protein